MSKMRKTKKNNMKRKRDKYRDGGRGGGFTLSVLLLDIVSGQYTVLGVTSWGSSACAVSTSRSVYANVPYLMSNQQWRRV